VSNASLPQLQGLVNAVQASCSDLHQLYKVKAALAAADSSMAHAQDQLQDIQHHQALFERHQHLVRTILDTDALDSLCGLVELRAVLLYIV
jgi:hypothetical protein